MYSHKPIFCWHWTVVFPWMGVKHSETTHSWPRGAKALDTRKLMFWFILSALKGFVFETVMFWSMFCAHLVLGYKPKHTLLLHRLSYDIWALEFYMWAAIASLALPSLSFLPNWDNQIRTFLSQVIYILSRLIRRSFLTSGESCHRVTTIRLIVIWISIYCALLPFLTSLAKKPTLWSQLAERVCVCPSLCVCV